MADGRPVAVWIRLSPEQRERVKRVARAVGMTMDTYARYHLLNQVTADEALYSDVIARQEMVDRETT